MKKSLFLMAAASAIMLTACTSEDDVVQTSASQKAEAKAVGFDVYTPAATNVTRAGGLQGTMTTGRLQRTEAKGGGFGVYAYRIEDAIPTSGDANATGYTSSAGQKPNFMVNEKLLWNATNQGWYYNPLKYWPNETDNDSQTSSAEMIGSASKSHLDRLTFFAYAPYVPTGFTPTSTGITAISDNNGQLSNPTATNVTDPTIAYTAAIANPNLAVDLLWGVAPAGGLTYTAVNGRTVNVEEGKPLIDMTKPDVNTNMKFLFQHALARINVNAVAAVDQIGAGGKLDPNTRITIKEITLTGYFGETGELNLNNNAHANVANWTKINGTAITSSSKTTGSKKTLTLNSNTIAEHLRYKSGGVAQTDRVGVTTVRQSVIEPNDPSTNSDWYTSKTVKTEGLAYSETTPYYIDPDCKYTPETVPVVDHRAAATVHSYNLSATPITITPVSSDYKVYTVNDLGVYTEYTSAPAALKYPNVNNYLVVPFHQVTAEDVSANKYDSYQAYTFGGSTYTPVTTGKTPVKDDYVIDGEIISAPALYPGVAGGTTYYKRDANYFMVVPTDNILALNESITAEEIKTLHTVRVKIEYYITTEDSKLDASRAQTENIIEKDVVFPSIANGKSYNLNLVLGLTSVKMEAEVDDWKVINVQGDLPQNTAE